MKYLEDFQLYELRGRQAHEVAQAVLFPYLDGTELSNDMEEDMFVSASLENGRCWKGPLSTVRSPCHLPPNAVISFTALDPRERGTVDHLKNTPPSAAHSRISSRSWPRTMSLSPIWLPEVWTHLPYGFAADWLIGGPSTVSRSETSLLVVR
jgi:hypothetical protein